VKKFGPEGAGLRPLKKSLVLEKIQKKADVRKKREKDLGGGGNGKKSQQL